MNYDLDLKKLGSRLATVDKMLVRLLKRRSDIARDVGVFKIKRNLPTVRLDIEETRLKECGELATKLGVSQHYVRQVLYSVIGESCKQQLILKEGTRPEELKDPENDDE